MQYSLLSPERESGVAEVCQELGAVVGAAVRAGALLMADLAAKDTSRCAVVRPGFGAAKTPRHPLCEHKGVQNSTIVSICFSMSWLRHLATPREGIQRASKPSGQSGRLLQVYSIPAG